jgi:hypothetical protein
MLLCKDMGIESFEQNDESYEDNTIIHDLSALRTEVVENKEAPFPVLGDMTHLALSYPNEAWAKNNNSSGITFQDMSPELMRDLRAANIYFEKWSPRPRNEKKNYVKFISMDEGLRAQELMLKRGNQPIKRRLMQRVWNGGEDWAQKNEAYANVVLKNAGIADGERRFSSLTAQEMRRLILAQIEKESPGLYREIKNRNIVAPTVIPPTYSAPNLL